jgi:BirA family transcriptional regulator, biotin operon repressor / biotin---[acetyl-CoA-carboxylase] ligase
MRSQGDSRTEAREVRHAAARCDGLAAGRGGLSMDYLADRTRAGIIGGPFFYYDEVGSTNAEARSLAIDGAPEGVAVFAESQTAGRGRLGRCWSSPAGKGLLVSVLLRPAHPMRDVHLLTLVTACAAAEAIESMADVSVRLKWPNDLFTGDRKVGGILLEVVGKQDVVDWVVAGIGINVNTELSELPAALSRTASSLKVASGTSLDRNELLARFLLRLDASYRAALDDGFAHALAGFRDRDHLMGRDISIQTKDGPVVGRAAGIDERGALLVRLPEQKMRSFHSGEVTLSS